MDCLFQKSIRCRLVLRTATATSKPVCLMGDWRHMHGAAFIGTGLRRNTVLRGSESIAYSASTAFNVILLRAAPISSGGWKIAAWRKRTTSRFDRFAAAGASAPKRSGNRCLLAAKEGPGL